MDLGVVAVVVAFFALTFALVALADHLSSRP
jgi:hypothetical protein